MSTTNTVLFAVGVFVFMMTIYGVVMAGGEMLKQKQLEQLADDTRAVVNPGGFDLFVTPTDDGTSSTQAGANR
ncbi:MAG: hypothetical protein ABIP17_01425 [Ilumatobacteraceae bacterium]